MIFIQSKQQNFNEAETMQLTKTLHKGRPRAIELQAIYKTKQHKLIKNGTL